MADDERRDREAPEENLLRIRVQRREFLRGLGLLGGALLYATPMLTACGTRSKGRRHRVFDIELPARYSVVDESFTLQLSPPGGKSVEVAFTARGEIALSATDSPDVAEVRLASLRFESKQEAPLRQAGVDLGRLSVRVEDDTVVGRLNLRDGSMEEKPITVTVEPSNGEPFRAQVDLTNPNVSQRANGPKCVKNNDITVPVSPTLPSLGAGRGKLRIGLMPSLG